jgi:uncharacterized membrane protein YfcA
MEQKNVSLWKCLLAGLAAGFVNGFFGAGGGMVLVPLLIWLVGLPDKLAFSSAISIILPLCIVSLVIYGRHDMLPLSDALPYLLGGAGGGVLAGLWFQKVPAKWLHLALGALILLGGVRLLIC